MQLRHIRPRTVKWYDALTSDAADGRLDLGPDEALRLRTLLAREQARTGSSAGPKRQGGRPRGLAGSRVFT
jgi:hypothetical protein